MKCQDVQERFGEYWDWPMNDIRRKQVDDHVGHCASCREEFDIWEESQEMLREGGFAEVIPDGGFTQPIASRVMEKIYAAESWKRPASDTIYPLSFRIRRNLSLFMAMCLALFAFGFLHALFEQPIEVTDPYDSINGIMPVASAEGSATRVSPFGESLTGIPVASISDPFMLSMGQLPNDPNYLLTVSLLGMIAAILMMNWISRVRQ